MSKTVDFYFDLSSPYAYMASTQIDELCERCGASASWKPFLLGAVFKATGNRAPATVIPKGKYMLEDLKEWAAYYGVGFAFPSSFPLNSVKPMRACLAAEEQGKLKEFVRAMYEAYWVNNKKIDEPDIIAEVAKSVGLDGEKLLARIEEQDLKDKLKDNTQAAIDKGAFGTPSMFVDDRMYWGNDRLPLLERYLKQG